MTTPLLRLARLVVLSAIAAMSTEPLAVAGEHVLVTFSGENSSQQKFSGYFEYDQSQSTTTDYYFNFTGSALAHMICYSTPSQTCSGSGPSSEPYTITTTNAGGFTLSSKCVDTNTTVVIKMTLNVGCTARALPLCTSGSTSVFPSTGTFTLSGGTTFSGNITATACQMQASLVPCTCPPPAIKQPVQGGPPVLGTGQNPPYFPPCPPTPGPFYVYCAPAPAPVYGCQPRRGCCLSGLLSRGSFRLGCR